MKPKPLEPKPLEEKLAVLLVYNQGGHHALSRFRHKDEIYYETYTYGGVPIDTGLTNKARKDIEANGIDWDKTSNVRESSMDAFQGTFNDSGTLQFYTVDIVSNSGKKYRFSLDMYLSELSSVIAAMEELKSSPLL